MTATDAMRARYVADSITTASPARLLTMLYDRLALDLAQLSAAFTAGNLEVAARTQRHAEDILIELRATLDLTVWPEGRSLAELYGFLLTELASAGAGRNAGRVDGCLALVEPLRETWHEAAGDIAAALPATTQRSA